MWPFSSKRARDGPAVQVSTIEVKEAFARSKRGAKLIDVRSPREYAHSGHPKGARSVPPQLIKKDRTGLDAR